MPLGTGTAFLSFRIHTHTVFRTSCLWDLAVGNSEGECFKAGTGCLSLWDKGDKSTEHKWMFDGLTMGWIWPGLKLWRAETDKHSRPSMRKLLGICYLHWLRDSKRTLGCWDIWTRCSMAGVSRKGSGRPSYYYRFLGKSRLQRQRSRSRSRSRPAASKGNKKQLQLLEKKVHCAAAFTRSSLVNVFLLQFVAGKNTRQARSDADLTHTANFTLSGLSLES